MRDVFPDSCLVLQGLCRLEAVPKSVCAGGWLEEIKTW